MDEIKDIIQQVIGQIASKKSFSTKSIQDIWEKTLEAKELSHVRLVNFEDGKLLVFVDSSAWLFQMSIKKRKILSKLNEGHGEIKNIIFKVGKVK